MGYTRLDINDDVQGEVESLVDAINKAVTERDKRIGELEKQVETLTEERDDALADVARLEKELAARESGDEAE